MGAECREITRLRNADVRDELGLMRKEERVAMCRSRLALCALVFAGGCAGVPGGTTRVEEPAEELLPAIRDYCWSGAHFAKVDFYKSAFIQFVNDDMVIYRLTSEPEALYCAYPVDNSAYKQLAASKGIKFAEYRSVIP